MQSARPRARRLSLALVGALAALLASLPASTPAAAQEPPRPEEEGYPSVARRPLLTAADELVQEPAQVIDRMYRIIQLEVMLARIGMEGAHHRDVRDYAERLWRDHRLAARRVRDTADDLDLDLPVGMPQDQVPAAVLRQIRQLRTLEGPAFDRMFLDLAERHQDAAIEALTVALLRIEVSSLEGLIGQVTPLLRQHYELARILDERVA